MNSGITGDNKTRELAVRNNNPGNIRQGSNGFRTYSSMEEGYGALVNQLGLYQEGDSAHTTGNETLLEAMKIYAPSSDNNNPTAYANRVAKAMGVTINTKISSLDLDKWAAAISQVESPQAYKELKRLGLV